jgi:hypothetical protein
VIDLQTDAFGPNADDGIVGVETAAQLGMTLPLFDFEDALRGGSGLSTRDTGAGSATGFETHSVTGGDEPRIA